MGFPVLEKRRFMKVSSSLDFLSWESRICGGANLCWQIIRLISPQENKPCALAGFPLIRRDWEFHFVAKNSATGKGAKSSDKFRIQLLNVEAVRPIMNVAGFRLQALILIATSSSWGGVHSNQEFIVILTFDYGIVHCCGCHIVSPSCKWLFTAAGLQSQVLNFAQRASVV
jgi:hypothetical protein